jgi:hypothetical protein
MGMMICGVAACQTLDSSGEILDMKGLDISSLTVDGTFNFEHEEKLTSQTVGKVLKAKKIFGEQDCETKQELDHWQRIKVPFLWVIGELFDDVGHSGAQDVAAFMRYDEKKRSEGAYDPTAMRPVVNFSIQGGKLAKAGNVITASLARRISVTITPCNKVAEAEQYKPEQMPEQPGKMSKISDMRSIVGKMFKAEEVQVEVLRKDEPLAKAKIDEGKTREQKVAARQGRNDRVGSTPVGWNRKGDMVAEGRTKVTGHRQPEKGVHTATDNAHGTAFRTSTGGEKGGKSVMGRSVRHTTATKDMPGVMNFRPSDRRTAQAKIDEARSLPKPNLPKSEVMAKAAPAGHIGQTSSGKHVMGTGSIHTYSDGFHAQDHKEAADLHYTAANTIKEHRQKNHHIRQAKAHMAMLDRGAGPKWASKRFSGAKPASEIKYVNIPGKGRGENKDLTKALDAGSPSQAPGTLTGGAALQGAQVDKKMHKAEKHKLLGSHGTKEGLVQGIKNFYYGTEVTLHDNGDGTHSVHNSKGKIDGVHVREHKGRWRFEMKHDALKKAEQAEKSLAKAQEDAEKALETWEHARSFRQFMETRQDLTPAEKKALTKVFALYKTRKQGNRLK